MENVLSKESDLLENKELRNQLAERVDVLDKVKEITFNLTNKSAIKIYRYMRQFIR